KDAEVASVTLLNLGLDLQSREVVSVGDEAEITARSDRDAASKIDVLADVVGAFNLDDAGNLDLLERTHGDIAVGVGSEHAGREDARVLSVDLVERHLDCRADLRN